MTVNFIFKIRFISIFRGFQLKPPNELSVSHSPYSPDSLIFFASGRPSGAFSDRPDKLPKRRCAASYSQTEPVPPKYPPVLPQESSFATLKFNQV
jgi:hypothetical protein